MKRLTIFIWMLYNHQFSLLFAVEQTRLCYVVLVLYMILLQNPSSFQVSDGFSRDLAWMLCNCFLKLEFFSWHAIQWQNFKWPSSSDAMVTLTPPTPRVYGAPVALLFLYLASMGLSVSVWERELLTLMLLITGKTKHTYPCRNALSILLTPLFPRRSFLCALHHLSPQVVWHPLHL